MLQIYSHLEPRGARLFSAAQDDGLTAPQEDDLRSRLVEYDLLQRSDTADLASWNPLRRRGVLRLNTIGRFWGENLNELGPVGPVFMDDPVYFEPLLHALDQRKIPVVAIVHNLESMASEQVVEERRMVLLGREIDLLRRCLGVVTISTEEAHWLEAWGVAAVHFPYYPIAAYQARYREVRRRRAGSPGHGVLFLANMNNLQNRTALERICALWQGLRDTFGPLVVAGIGLGAWKGEIQGAAGVDFLGTLDDERFDDLLASIGCLLCYQERGSGALTRIPEALLCGVPVVANFNAARSYHHRQGVWEFRGRDDLPAALHAALGHRAPIPEPRAPDPALLEGLLAPRGAA
ncbi:MAG: hypothetical protein V1750_04280 [Acidobacteriota bacterium]